jgi:hypothetical protein
MVIFKEAQSELSDYVKKIDEMTGKYEELKMVVQKFKGFNPTRRPFEVFVRTIDHALKEIKGDIATAKDIVSKQK